MAIPFSNTHYRIPRGFGNLLEGLTREVLREQPKDIPDFAAKYFANLLKKREETGFDPTEWGAQLEDRFYNNYSFKPKEIREQQQKSSSFDTKKAQKISHDGDQENQTSENYLLKMKASTTIQAAYRGHLERKKVKQMKSDKKAYLDVSSDEKVKAIQEIDSSEFVGTTHVESDMTVAGIMEGHRGNLQFTTGPLETETEDHLERESPAKKQDGAGELEQQEDEYPEAVIDALIEHGFTVEEPEEFEISSTPRDQLSDEGEITITLEETEMNADTLEQHEGYFVEETQAYIVEESEESRQEGSSTPVYLQDEENESTAISQAEETGESSFKEEHVTSEEEPTQ